MAWEWVAPVAAASGASVIAIAGTYFTYRAGARQTRVALQTAKMQIDGALAEMREEKRLARLETAYTELSVLLNEVKRWALQVFADARDDGRYYLPEMPQSAETRRDAIVMVAWSPDVERAFEAWSGAMEQLNRIARTLEAALRDDRELLRSGIRVSTVKSELANSRQELLQRDLDLRALIWQELNAM